MMMQENKTRGQVLWPKLVANKLLRRPLRDNSYVTDLPCTEVLHEAAAEWDHGHFASARLFPCDDQKSAHKYKILVSTWNVGGVQPSDGLNLEDWLDVKNGIHDIYVLGFQEVVPLNAKNVLGAAEKSTRTHMKWNKLIRTALNRSLSKTRGVQDHPAKGAGEKQKVHPFKEGCSSDHGGFMGDFRCIVSKQMVGLLISVWVRSDLRRFIRHPGVSCVGCGIMGCLGNKGSVSVRFYLQETSFCFVCCHLASGGKQGDEFQRNSDAAEILSRTIFPSSPSLHLAQKILHHDRVILLGDLNYRISLPESSTRSLVEQKQWPVLLEKDQLRLEVSVGRVFAGWNEGQITFSPTYKYHPNSDTYCGCSSIQGKKGEKKRRAPAWCDRILWHGNGIKQMRYERYESRLSDHRPVRAVFTVDVEASRSVKTLRSYFLSERFDGRTTAATAAAEVERSVDQSLFPDDDQHLRKTRSSIIYL